MAGKKLTLFLYCTQSVNIKRKSDMIFQIIYYITHNGKQKAPFHISLTEAIHDTCRSKTLVQINYE